MEHPKFIKGICATMVILSLAGCIEPFDATIEEFESALVIDAFITDELKDQQIVLSRAYRFEQDSAAAETNAQVKIVTNDNRTLNFSEVSPGKYMSDAPFKAEPNTAYTLSVQTNNGRSYTSNPAQLQSEAKIDSVYAVRTTNEFGEEGMAIFLDSFDPSGTSRFYRFEYEETYRVIAPRWNPMEFKIVNNNNVPAGAITHAITDTETLIRVPRTEEARVCYGSDHSRNIIITRTDDSEEDRLVRFNVHFINRNNYILTHRYSILVRQFTMSEKAYNYYETLKELSSLESVFSENQPGYFEGNVFSDLSQAEHVLGYFDVSSISEKRIFFDYEDFFHNERKPSYAIPCKPIKPLTLMESVRLGHVTYNDPSAYGEEPEFIAIERACGDCRVLGSNVAPSFWVD
ncbi:DUF4249 domain-containing protein [Flagellimonas myxillae]|uniref:DUF4249 domain-containing protein n=1 Tax=Flagellimonas myxillae TaxID=2942214 RepID=UPI00201EBFD4|nr:DUF4249 domain-containing protein [Muricauda myxillae]MCL6266560.1 DUF4249 domain-containing protein [Muricauda myxillae]